MRLESGQRPREEVRLRAGETTALFARSSELRAGFGSMKSTSCSPSVGGLQKRQESTRQRFGLLFRDKVARVGDHLRFNILKVRTQQFTHVRNGILPAYCQETDRDFIPELLLVEIHVVEDPPAVVESRIHSSISRV